MPRMKRHLPGLILLLLAAPAVPLSAATERAEREVEKTHPVDDLERVRVEQLAGPVRVRVGSEDEIRVRALVRAGAQDADEVERIVEKGGLELDPEGNRLRVRPRLPLDEYSTYYYEPPGREGGGFNRNAQFADQDVTVQSRTRWGRGIDLHHEIELIIPPGMGVDIQQQVGRVDVEGVSGPLRLRMRGEQAELRDLRGPLDIETGGGRLRLAGHEGEGRIRSGSGEMHLSNLRGGPWDLESGSGPIRVDSGAGEFRVKTGSGGFQATEFVAAEKLDIISGSGRVMLEGDLSALRDARIETSSADIFLQTVRVPSAELRINHVRGGITVDLPEVEETRRQRNRFEGILGEGAGRIELESRLGEIRFTSSPAGAVEGGLFQD